MLSFEPFPKIGRLNAAMTVTEKIDGTNGQLQFDSLGNMLVGSRKRQIFPEGTFFAPESNEDPGALKPVKGTDNFGFAQWAYRHQYKLFDFLGEGRHYGEWAGNGIQRGYGMTEKRFFLFNAARFGPGRQEVPQDLLNIGLDSVPVLYEGEHDQLKLDEIMYNLYTTGSYLNEWKPEGIIVYMHGVKELYKRTFEHEYGKWKPQPPKMQGRNIAWATVDEARKLVALDDLRL